MLTLKDYFSVVDHRICEGSAYQWLCWGPNAWILDSRPNSDNRYTVTVIFDTLTQAVYASMAYDYTEDRAYRWLNPLFEAPYRAECLERNCEDTAWDLVDYTDLDLASDFLDRARAVVLGPDPEPRVQVPLDLDKATLFRLMKQAHEADLTLNEFVEKLLQPLLDQGPTDDNLS